MKVFLIVYLSIAVIGGIYNLFTSDSRKNIGINFISLVLSVLGLVFACLI